MSTVLTPAAGRRFPAPAAVALVLVLLAHGWLLGAFGTLRPTLSPSPGVAPALQVRTLQPRAVRAPPPPQLPAPVPERSVAATPSRAEPAPGRSPAPAGTPTPPPEDVSAADGGGSPVPVYRTRLPPSGAWTYRLRRGGREGEARLQWRHDAERYEARLSGGPDGEESLQWHSTGAIDAAGLAPGRFVDRRDRRREAANFDREAGRIGYSGRDGEQPLYPGSQDRLSLLLQLAAILEGRRTPAAVGEEVLVHVSGARGDSAVWRFEVQGPERVRLPDGSQRFALKLLREPAGPYDLRVEVWTDPGAGHLPLRVTMRNGPHELELLLQGPTDTR